METMKKIIIDKSRNASEIEAKILATPPIKCLEFKKVNYRSSLLCLQSEYGILVAKDIPEKSNPIQYIGTKELYDCIFLCIYNDGGEYLFAHLDCQPFLLEKDRFNFTAALKEFKSQKNLKLMLVGGKDDAEYDTSKENFKYIVKQLIQLAKDMDTTITLTHQKILHHNQIKIQHLHYIQYYDDLLDHAMLFFSRLYKSLLSEDFLNGISPEDFKKSTDSSEIKELEGFLAMLPVATNFDVEIEIFVSNFLATAFPGDSNTNLSKEKFYTYLRAALSKEGFPFVKSEFDEQTQKSQFDKQIHVDLPNFVFDLKEHKVYAISKHTPTHSETARRAQYCDPSQDGYFKFYNNQKYQPVKLSSKFSSKCDDLITKDMELKTIKSSSIANLLEKKELEPKIQKWVFNYLIERRLHLKFDNLINRVADRYQTSKSPKNIIMVLILKATEDSALSYIEKILDLAREQRIIIDLNLTNSEGLTILDLAHRKQRQKIVSLLEKEGAKTSIELEMELAQRKLPSLVRLKFLIWGLSPRISITSAVPQNKDIDPSKGEISETKSDKSVLNC